MGIRNYTSTVAAHRSIAQIQKRLAAHGARRSAIDYDDGEPVAITFTMVIAGGPVQYRLAPDVGGMLKAMEQDSSVPAHMCTEAQAKRTSWKNELDWLHAQLAKVAANQARLEQLLLGYAVTDNGETFYERLYGGDRRLLLPGTEDTAR